MRMPILPSASKLSFAIGMALMAMSFANNAQAGGGNTVHDIDFEFTDFSAFGTRRLPLGDELELVETRIEFNLSTETTSFGHTLIAEQGDGDGILELGESTFVEGVFVIHLDISFEDIDPMVNFANSLSGPQLGSILLFENVVFDMGDNPFVAQCDVGFGAFGGCGMLMDTDDYDLQTLNDPLELGFDVTGDMIDDDITTVPVPGMGIVPDFPGLEIDFGNNPLTTIDEDTVTQDYIIEIDWLININPDVDIGFNGLATVVTTAEPATVVPVPPALWLFGSAILALIARRSGTRTSL